MNKFRFAFFIFSYIMFLPLIIVYGAVFGAINECIDVWKLLKKMI